MFETPSRNERAVLVHLASLSDHHDLSELSELTISAGAVPVGTVTGATKTPNPRNFLGQGKLEELKAIIELEKADLVLINHALTPGQEKNLQNELGLRVIDRNSLILDIFAQRAQSFEGKLQVELAQLRHLSTRLIRGWTHLERQKGGIGLRGPGETQLETDRRLIGVRIKSIQQRLQKVEKQRCLGRISRKKSAIRTVALVGYTNSGKSTLFNRLTGAEVYTADQLFATLDPTLRRCPLSRRSSVVMVDTVGFIRHLPHELVAAFRATLQEASEADLLLHVIDAGSETKHETIDQVNQVLCDIGANNIPQIEVYNKIDVIENLSTRIERNHPGIPVKVWLSSKTGDGISFLKKAIEDSMLGDSVRRNIHLTSYQAGIRSKLFDLSVVLKDETDQSGGWKMQVEIKKKDLGILRMIKTEQESASGTKSKFDFDLQILCFF